MSETYEKSVYYSRIVTVLENKHLRDVFLVIAEARSLRFNQILQKVKVESIEQLDGYLKELEYADLIKVRNGPIPGLGLCYLTVNGLSVSDEIEERQIKL